MKLETLLKEVSELSLNDLCELIAEFTYVHHSSLRPNNLNAIANSVHEGSRRQRQELAEASAKATIESQKRRAEQAAKEAAERKKEAVLIAY
jgi:hypothetical protein